MKKVYKLIFLCIVLLSGGITLQAQPSSSISFDFRLFNKKGEIIDMDKFCNHFKLTRREREIKVCVDSASIKEVFYLQVSKRFRLSASTVYQDFELSFINKKDTMSIRIINSGYGAIITIDSLIFTPGKYAITCNSRIVNGKTLPNLPILTLKQIDFKKARADYYNFYLDMAKRFFDSSLKLIVRQLQKMYHIPYNDLNHKTDDQLSKY